MRINKSRDNSFELSMVICDLLIKRYARVGILPRDASIQINVTFQRATIHSSQYNVQKISVSTLCIIKKCLLNVHNLMVVCSRSGFK